MTDKYHKIFFSKDNISSLNKLLLQQSNYQNLTREGKQELIDILIKNMKIIYKSMDISKISNNNFNSIFEQFNKYSLNESLKEISKTNNLSNLNKQPSELKFQRDFNSFPNSGNKLIDRPTSTKNISNNNNTNINLVPNRPPSTSSNPNDVNDFNNSTRPFNKVITQSDFQTMDSSQFNTGFNGLANDLDENIYSLDNIDKPIMNDNFDEDISSFEDRLKKLQSERDIVNGNMRHNISSSSIDFTSENFPKNDSINTNIIQNNNNNNNNFFNNFDQLNNYNDKNNQQSRDQQLRDQQLRDQQLRDQQLRDQQLRDQQLREQQLREQQLREQQQIREQQLREQQQIREQQLREQQLREQQLRDQQLMDQQLRDQQLREKQIITLDQTKDLQIRNTNQSRDIITNLINDIDNLKEQNKILLYEKTKFESKSNDLIIKEMELNKKEIELLRKENNINEIIQEYSNLFKIQYIQMEVSSIKNESCYTWNINNSPNIIGIKLVLHYIPFSKYNIEDYNNNFKININDEIHEIKLLNGNYTINQLIDEMNRLLCDFNIKLSINIDQKIILNSNQSISIIPTKLSTQVLGFINDCIESIESIQSEECETKYIYEAERQWDLRKNEEVYLYLTNLSDKPFGILYPNEKSNCYFKLENSYILDKLDIEFRDCNNNICNFYNLPHKLVFLLEVI